MRLRKATWFETKVSYQKMMEDGLEKKVTELYVLDAFTFTDAEARMTEEMSSYVSGEFKITDIKPASYGEIVFSDAADAESWFKVKIALITLDEKSGKEKRQSVYYLVQASTLRGAVSSIDEFMRGTMCDYEVASVAKTAVLDVFEHHANPLAAQNED